MKKVLTVLLISVLLFSYSSNVFASTITWKQITDKFKENLSEEDLQITSDDTSMTVTKTYQYEEDEEEKEYIVTLLFKYEDNVVTFIPKDKINLSDDEKILYLMYEEIAPYYMLDTIEFLYNVDLSDLDENEISNYGIIYKTTEYNYSNQTENSNTSITVDQIDEFSVDLDVFEEAAKNYKPKTPDNNTNTNNNSNTSNITNTTGKKDGNNITDNPKTGTVIYCITIVSAIISLISFVSLYIKEKKQKLGNS